MPYRLLYLSRRFRRCEGGSRSIGRSGRPHGRGVRDMSVLGAGEHSPDPRGRESDCVSQRRQPVYQGADVLPRSARHLLHSLC